MILQRSLVPDTTMVPYEQTAPDERTRRRFLKTGLAALSTGVAAGTAGCLSGLPPLGERQSYGRLDVPDADAPAYRRWLPDPETFDDDRSRYTFLYTRPAPVRRNDPEEFRYRQAATKAQVDYFGVGYRQFDALLDVPYGTVVEADFDPASVARTLTESGYHPDGTYRQYDLFSRSDVARRVAVGDGTVVWSSRRVHDAPDVEALLDTAAGARQRYHDADDAFARLTDAIGASRMVIGGPAFGDPTDRAELGADGFRFSEDAVYQVIKLIFPEDDVPSTDALERAFRGSYRMTDEARVFDATVDGRLATVETRVLRERPGSRGVRPLDDPPQVTWGVSYDADETTVTLRHEAGESVDSELLWYDIDTEASPGEIETRPLWNARRVAPGDEATVDLSDRSDPTTVNVFLSEGRGCCGFRKLFEYRLEWAHDD